MIRTEIMDDFLETSFLSNIDLRSMIDTSNESWNNIGFTGEVDFDI